MKNLESMSSGKFALSKEEQMQISGGFKVYLTYEKKDGDINDVCVEL